MGGSGCGFALNNLIRLWFFFSSRRRHTRFDCDWSSDVCSSDLPRSDVAVYAATLLRSGQARAVLFHLGASGASRVWLNGKLVHEDLAVHPSRFEDRKSVV